MEGIVVYPGTEVLDTKVPDTGTIRWTRLAKGYWYCGRLHGGVLEVRVAIVEDKVKDQENLCALFAEEAHIRGWMYTTETYLSGETFLSAEGPFDIVFLDVMLNGIDGLETARRYRIRGGRGLVVFITVEADFAIEGYEVEAAGFQIKPAEREHFHRVMKRLARKFEKDVMLSLDSGEKISVGTVLYATATDHCLKIHIPGKVYFPD